MTAMRTTVPAHLRESRQTAVSHRNSSLELLRIISALMILGRHLVGENALDVSAQALSPLKVVCQSIIYAGGKVGVVLFFLISAWFLCDGEQTIRRCAKRVWILERELLFYSLVLIAFALSFDLGPVSLKTALGGPFPLLTDLWWYTSSYAAFLLVLPFLQPGLRALGEAKHRAFCLVVVVVWGVASGLLPGIGLDTESESVLTFIGYFVLVSYAKWYGRALSVRVSAVMVAAGAVLSVCSVLAIELAAQILPASLSARTLARETFMGQDEWMLPVSLMAVGMFRLFLELDFSSLVVDRLASCTLAVYLISQHPSIWPWLWGGVFPLTNVWDKPWCIAYMLAAIAAVFLACCVVDFARQVIFKATVDRKRGVLFERAWGAANRAARGILGR